MKTFKDELLQILNKYKVVGDVTFGLGYEDANKLVDEIIREIIKKYVINK